jgi:hypothetical protein
MNNKIVILIGIVILIFAFVFFIISKKESSNTAQDLQNSAKKEILVGKNICSEFPKDWVSSILIKTIIKTEALESSGTNICQYYTDNNNFVTLRLNNLNVENQKKGQIELGRTINTNPKIKAEHFIAVQDNGLINGIYLIINPNLFIVVDRTSAKAASEEEIINFAASVAKRIQSGENTTTQITPTSNSMVPLPQREDIVRNFFNLINEGKIPEAINMLTPNNTSDESIKQAWGVQFNAFEKITVNKIENSFDNTYKVTLNVLMKPESANAKPMPYYGWGDGEFVRWVSLEKINNLWKISGIATGP